MKSIAKLSGQCAQRAATSPKPARARHADNVRWARSFIAQPARSAEHARHQLMVADLLGQIDAEPAR